ncbi:hypothetical protein DL897_08965 [Thermoflavimicrobium daqui]|uniref:Metallo-beta-lactamase domain-containing protein n=1 Tax=Thermoflavimicrobium daqui TaxID=2137476 RepID=A0A364K510_9BACL|nr:hypothetical protein DL897_08965 [Thermoflavimicrobium daqui]
MHKDGTTLVDAGVSMISRGILKFINQLQAGPLQRIVLAHGHSDHIGALKKILKEKPVPVYAHPIQIMIKNGFITITKTPSRTYSEPKCIERMFCMATISPLCRRFAQILGGTPQVVNGVCTVTRIRNISMNIQGRPSRSPLALAALFSFESIDRQGRALNLGETVIFQREVNPFLSALRRRGIIVSALHNHWMFDRERSMYIHWQSVENPITFARKTAEAFRVLER